MEARTPSGRQLPSESRRWLGRGSKGVSCNADLAAWPISMGWTQASPSHPRSSGSQGWAEFRAAYQHLHQDESPHPSAPICCAAQGVSPLHPSIVWGVSVIQERKIFSELLRQTQMQPDSPATVSCVCGSVPLCLSWQHAFHSQLQTRSLRPSWGPRYSSGLTVAPKGLGACPLNLPVPVKQMRLAQAPHLPVGPHCPEPTAPPLGLGPLQSNQRGTLSPAFSKLCRGRYSFLHISSDYRGR